ncbi:hypothetical protein PQO03_08715 [Lentisphaera profundi]|uniref:Uncharacterized protein n=1 Tax=Lentisphaera profundi TaxID=1658616 RepID=A0ABY7VNT3_9BACT|nr:hypothetical protein [Lentisphaera profundi]WDE95796.1 hypothetical protein PQO03_08715 [Lentisphaera profundi]
MDIIRKKHHSINTSPWTSFSTITEQKSSLFKQEIQQVTGSKYIPLSSCENKKNTALKKFRCYLYVNKKIKFFTIELLEKFLGKIHIIKISSLKSWRNLAISNDLCDTSCKIFQAFIKNTHGVKYFPLGHELNLVENESRFSFSCIAMMTNMGNSLLILKLILVEDKNNKLHFQQVDRL